MWSLRTGNGQGTMGMCLEMNERHKADQRGGSKFGDQLITHRDFSKIKHQKVAESTQARE